MPLPSIESARPIQFRTRAAGSRRLIVHRKIWLVSVAMTDADEPNKRHATLAVHGELLRTGQQRNLFSIALARCAGFREHIPNVRDLFVAEYSWSHAASACAVISSGSP
jgi:hypothetical protein